MQALLNLLEQQKNWKEFIKKSCRKNKINVDIASYFTPNKIRSLYDRFLKLYENKNEADSTCWFENELKAFHWFLVVLSGLRQRSVQNFGDDEWKVMNEIFLNKDESIMEYEAIKLVNERANKNRLWTQQETDLLTQIIKQNQNSNKWNDIARKLFQRSSHKFFRSGKQCRQRWLNHLDPNKKRGQWEQEQDKLIVGYILKYGRRWSNISKQLGNHRTEHMVKNRFKTLIIKQKKLTPKISNENSLLRQIGKRLLGQDYVPQKKLALVKEQNADEEADSGSMSDQQQESEKEASQMVEQKGLKKTEAIIPPFEEMKGQGEQEIKKQVVKRQSIQSDMKSLFRDPIISQVMEDCSKGMGSVSTPLSSYELQQIYSPFYINYTGLTPYLSPSPSIPFFMNSSFSSFDNSFNQNLFIKPSQKNDEKE